MTWLLAVSIACACSLQSLRDAACAALCAQDGAISGRWDARDNSCVCGQKRDFKEMQAVRVQIKTFRSDDPPQPKE